MHCIDAQQKHQRIPGIEYRSKNTRLRLDLTHDNPDQHRVDKMRHQTYEAKSQNDIGKALPRKQDDWNTQIYPYRPGRPASLNILRCLRTLQNTLLQQVMRESAQ